MTSEQERLLKAANEAFHAQQDGLKVAMDAKAALMEAIAVSARADHQYMLAMKAFHRAMTADV
jgi:hypothetical protein